MKNTNRMGISESNPPKPKQDEFKIELTNQTYCIYSPLNN